MVSTATVAELGALMGDPGRANMLIALLEGRALTARELADRAGVTPQTASGHLSRLIAAGMIRVEKQGRHRYHSLASSDVADLLEAIHVAGSRISTRSRGVRAGGIDPAMRRARSCYDHVAGSLGVALADALTSGEDAGLSPEGESRLRDWGIDVDAVRGLKRPFYRRCLDWSERRPHIAGGVGAAILERSLALGWLRRREGCRALLLSKAGEEGYRSVFGISRTAEDGGFARLVGAVR